MDRDDIERITRDYWELSQNRRLNEALHYYVCEGHKRLDGKSLLEVELECARREERIKATPCETLVLLVGFSLEPLLQSVCVYQPKRIALVLNEEGYAGEEWQVFAGRVTEVIGHLVTKGLIPQPPQFLGEQAPGAPGYPTVGEPAAVFQVLTTALHDEMDVVIDVTGGKKSMVSGAFMYAAYAGTRISYVDFEDYDPKHRRPYGCSCKIGGLSNPYQEFALREWERVRALYERYQFRDARKLLEDSILNTMKTVIPEAEAPILRLAAFLDYYEMWDRGDFRGAKQAAQTLDACDQPSAVTVLGDQWYEISGNDFANVPKHFYGNLSALKVYVHDELERVQRLIEYNQDYRSAFLRAGGVNEIVMLARVVRLVTSPTGQSSLLDALEEKTPGAYDVFEVLVEPTGKDITIGTDRKKCDLSFKKAPTITVLHPSPMQSWWQATSLFNAADGWDQFLTKRNELAHKYFSVPRAWAEDALKFVQANSNDFLGQPMSTLGLRATALPWPALCGLCEVSQFLPPTLRKEV